ncbi:MAG: hypothetical protein ACK4VO_13175 [Pseudobdellovibrio sp.]
MAGGQCDTPPDKYKKQIQKPRAGYFLERENIFFKNKRHNNKGANMQLTLDFGLINDTKKDKTKSQIVLTLRDYEIIKFILEMKYSTVEDIYLRYFKINSLGLESITNRSAYRRLQLLEENGFLKSERNFILNEKIYLATSKSYYLILNHFKSEIFISYPLKKIDHRTFEHDHLLVSIRYNLETIERIHSWMSDRYLKSKSDFNDLNAFNIIPDAIYTNLAGDKIAFELELTQKSKDRYRSKIKSIVEYLRKIENKPKAFSKVRFMCKTKAIYESLNNESKLYSKYFQIEYLTTDSALLINPRQNRKI